WRRWFTICRRALLALILAFIALHAWWGVSAERALDAQIREYAGLGEPTYVIDLNDSSVPDEENGVVPLRQAKERLTFSLLDRLNLDPARLRLPLTPAQGRMIASLIHANQQSLHALDSAATRPSASWSINLR